MRDRRSDKKANPNLLYRKESLRYEEAKNLLYNLFRQPGVALLRVFQKAQIRGDYEAICPRLKTNEKERNLTLPGRLLPFANYRNREAVPYLELWALYLTFWEDEFHVRFEDRVNVNGITETYMILATYHEKRLPEKRFAKNLTIQVPAPITAK